VRTRLLISTLLVAVTAVLLLGVPLAIVMSRLVTDDAAQQLQHDATTAARDLQYHASSGQAPDYKEIEEALPDEYITIRRGTGAPVGFGHRPPRHRVSSAQASSKDFTVTVEIDSSATTAGVIRARLLVGALALVSVGAAVGLAVLQARRFTRPLEELARSAEQLGSGDARPLGRSYGLPELDKVAERLDDSARRVSDLLTAEREFAADASHQLRTPLTALSMRLEEMIAAADDPQAVRTEGEAALTQTERLADVVSQLLGSRRVNTTLPRVVGIDDVLAQQVAEWEPAFRRANRKLEVAGYKGLHCYATAGTVAQVIATLLDNALVHGAGTVMIRTSRTPRSAVVEVRDEGRGVPPELVPRIFERNVSSRPHGTGLGLALARGMAVADGGRVVLVRPKPAVFALFLPLAAPDTEEEEPVVSGPV
jgi:signal transduction histidine kinase